MSPATLTAPPPMPRPRFAPDATPQQIIAQARTSPARARAAFVQAALSGLLLWCAFTPLDWGPLGWVALAPLFCLARLEKPTRRMYLSLYAAGFLYWLATLQWLRLGDPLMYIAWLAVSLYFAVYFPACLGLCRIAVQRFRVPLCIAGPVVWTGLELLRSRLLTGFPWYALSHTQHRWVDFIQASDLVGSTGLSFVLALVSATLAELLPQRYFERFRLLPPSQLVPTPLPELSARGRWAHSLAAVLVVLAVLAYGGMRRAGVTFEAGPRVALIQSNVTCTLNSDPREWPEIHRRQCELTGRAMLQQPDVVVWPETMFPWPIVQWPQPGDEAALQLSRPLWDLAALRERDRAARFELTRLSQMTGAALVVGLTAIDAQSPNVSTYNSAQLIDSQHGLTTRYDKLHRVLFGEYIPLAEMLPHASQWRPLARDYGIQAGAGCVAFEYKGWRFAPLICYEDTVPQLVRGIINATTIATPAGARRVDFLCNLTNDGWFHGSSEHDQHLITAAFRCVECRTPMVRAVNTGISAIIDGDGVVRRRALDVETGRSKLVEAVVCGEVPLDRRTSFYLAGGDWFSHLCVVGCAALLVGGLVPRRAFFKE